MMRIDEKLKQKKPMISFEIFPPKKNKNFQDIDQMLQALGVLAPDFISVTYGAGGSAQNNRTAVIASRIQREYGIDAMAHLTCIGADKKQIREKVAEIQGKGIENILALRGDLPPDTIDDGAFQYAKDLIEEIARQDICIGAAAYPEGHIHCEKMEDNIEHLYQKQEAGASFFVTQLFFENDLFYRFYETALSRGITPNILPGIMPMLSRSQVEKMIFMCAASLPAKMIKLLNRYSDSPEDLKAAGIDYALEQLEDLLQQGMPGVHLYTMNKPEIAASCMEVLHDYRP